MTLSIVPVDQAGIDNIADGLSGFTDESSELQQSMMTTLFIAGASDASRLIGAAALNGNVVNLARELTSHIVTDDLLDAWIALH